MKKFWQTVSIVTLLFAVLMCSACGVKVTFDIGDATLVSGELTQKYQDDSPIVAPEVEKEGYVLEFGHLSKDKGTETLLEAAKSLPEVNFVFAGTGDAERKIAQIPNGVFVGFKTGEELELLIRKAAISVYPSQWYENCPFSVIESQMYGTPVIGSRMGGIPELIEEGKTGELFEAGYAAQLAEKLRKLLFTPGLAAYYSENCKNAKFETPDSYYEKLLAVYGG